MNIENLINTDPLIITGAIFLILACILLLFNIRATILANSSKTWEITKGKVLQSELYVYEDSDSVSFKPKVLFSYILNGIEHKSKRIYFGSNIMSTFKKRKSKNIVEKYKIGQIIDVYYNPANEKMAVLETGIKSELITGVIFGVILFLLGLLLLERPDLIIELKNKFK